MPAFEAERTLRRVIDELPLTPCGLECRVLVIDDGSSDRTFASGLDAAAASAHTIEVLATPCRLGYGGNQKIAFDYALRQGFELVVLVHGDGKFSPAAIPDLVAPLLAGESDAVIGSRLLAPRPGGQRMPLHRRAAIRALTRLQNALLGTRLSDLHSGCRSYRVAALAQIPFARNTDSYHFDTEVLLQLIASGARITETAIPSYSGDELRGRRAIRYCRDVVASTLRFRVQPLGIHYDRKFDLLPEGHQQYLPKLHFDSSHSAAVAAVAAGSRVVDIGCGSGVVARELRAKRCWVLGIDAHRAAPEAVDAFQAADLDDPLEVDLRGIDYVLMLDIVEHLRRPEAFLERLRAAKRDYQRPPAVILTTPNIAFLPLRLQLLWGEFNYGKRGILDRTHTRLLTEASLRRLLQECGFAVEAMRGIPAPFPLAVGDGRLGGLLLALNRALIRFSRRLFAYQLLVVARPLPTIGMLWHATLEASSGKRADVAISVASSAAEDL